MSAHDMMNMMDLVSPTDMTRYSIDGFDLLAWCRSFWSSCSRFRDDDQQIDPNQDLHSFHAQMEDRKKLSKERSDIVEMAMQLNFVEQVQSILPDNFIEDPEVHTGLKIFAKRCQALDFPVSQGVIIFLASLCRTPGNSTMIATAFAVLWDMYPCESTNPDMGWLLELFSRRDNSFAIPNEHELQIAWDAQKLDGANALDMIRVGPKQHM